MHGPTRRLFGVGLGASAFLSGCGPAAKADYQPRFAQTDPSDQREYTFAVHPLHNPQMLHRRFGPLMSYLEAQVGARFRLVASNDYAAFESRMSAGSFDFALANPYQALRATEQGYRVFAKETDDDQFRGVVVVRRDAGIKLLADLAGKTISYPAPTAVAATMMVKSTTSRPMACRCVKRARSMSALRNLQSAVSISARARLVAPGRRRGLTSFATIRRSPQSWR